MNAKRRTGLRWAIYARISHDKKKNTDDEGTGVENQVEELKTWIYTRDPEADIVGIYVDNDIPASGKMTKRKNRPEFNRLRVDARNKVIQAAAAWHLDRYTRRPRELEDMIDIAESCGTLFHTMTGDIDLTTPGGRMFGRMLANWGAYEGELKVERMQLAFAAIAATGKAHSGGMRCYGYTDDDLSLIPHEVEIINEIADRALPPKAESVRSLCRELKERGVITVTGKSFTPTTIHRLLTNPRLRGARVYRGEIVKEEAFPRIFTDEKFAQIDAFMNEPDRKLFGEPRRKNLLSGGILICGRCGHNLQSQPSNSKRPGYVCRTSTYGGCGRMRIQAEPVETDIAAKVLGVFASPRVRQQVHDLAAAEGDVSIATEIRRIEDRLAQLGREYAAGDMERIAYAAAQNMLTGDLNKLRGRLRETQMLSGLPVDLPDTPARLAVWWTDEETTLEQRRALIKSVLKHVAVGPSIRRGYNGFEPDRLTYVWK